LVYASDLSNQENLAFFQNISERISKYEAKLVFFTIAINKIEEAHLTSILQDKNLQKFLPFIKSVRLFKNHQLNEESEKILIDKAVTSSASWIRFFDENVNNLKFKFGKKILNSQEIFDLMANKNGNIRKNAAKAISITFADNIKNFAFITNILAKDKSIEDDLRGFANPISSRNLANDVEDEIVDIMVNKVRDNYSKISHRYYQIKAKILKKQQLNYWDRNAPLPSQDSQRISFQEAKNMVLDSYEEFHPKMRMIGEKFFANNWIDAKVRSGKDSGAFSHPAVPSVHPYILMNYQGKVRDVMTLAHELGHGIHQILASQQGYLMSHTPLTLAETASVFGEQLTFQSILRKQKKPLIIRNIIASKVEDMINTVIRQIAFLQFEHKVHNHRKNGEIAIEDLNKFWLEVQKESLGDVFIDNQDYRFFWCYIPHFIHSPFYVYAYAFGDCLVNSLYAIYQTRKIGNFADKYLEMLSMGGTKHHKELLSPFGIDISKAEFWQFGLDVISSMIDQIENYC
jgi:oligoendopeptidase F